MACTHTDEELREILVPELANRIRACEEPLRVWATRFWKTGARFDAVDWARKVEQPSSSHSRRSNELSSRAGSLLDR
jgi:hypothetical protein